MKLSVGLNRKIVNFLTTIPNIHDSYVRQVLIDSAGLDDQLKNQIVYTGSSQQFSQTLVSTLTEYGQLENRRDALEAILETAKDYVGWDRRAYCDKLIQELCTFQKPSSPGIQVTIHVEIHETLYNEDLRGFLQQLCELSTFKKSNRFNLILS